jgi:hypothetical protein
MAHISSPLDHPAHHPLARAAGIDLAIVTLSVGAVVLTFLTGNGEPRWQNLVFAPAVILLAAVVIRLIAAEIREFRRHAADSGHPLEAIASILVPLVAMIVVAPLVLLMPFVFFGAMF